MAAPAPKCYRDTPLPFPLPPLRSLLPAGAPIDGRVKVRRADALALTRRRVREFGLLVGTSTGANVGAALPSAKKLGPAARVVIILCAWVERYFPIRLFTETPARAS